MGQLLLDLRSHRRRRRTETQLLAKFESLKYQDQVCAWNLSCPPALVLLIFLCVVVSYNSCESAPLIYYEQARF
jgi:hypothetical protein